MSRWRGPLWLRIIVVLLVILVGYAYGSYARRECERRGGTMQRRTTAWGTSRRATCSVPE